MNVAELSGLMLSERAMKLWNMDHSAHQEIYSEKIEFGGIDSGNEVSQVFASALELKDGESGKDSRRWWREDNSVGVI